MRSGPCIAGTPRRVSCHPGCNGSFRPAPHPVPRRSRAAAAPSACRAAHRTGAVSRIGRGRDWDRDGDSPHRPQPREVEAAFLARTPITPATNIRFKNFSRQDAKKFLGCGGFSPDRRIAAPTTTLAISLLSLRSLRLCESSFLQVSRTVCQVEAIQKRQSRLDLTPGRTSPIGRRSQSRPPCAG